LGQLLKNIEEYQASQSFSAVSDRLLDAFSQVLFDEHADPMLISRLIMLPKESYVSEFMALIDPLAVSNAVQYLKHSCARFAEKKLAACYHRCNALNTGQYTARETGCRALRDTCLDFLIALDTDEYRSLCIGQLDQALCMTDADAALIALSKIDHASKQQRLDDFYRRWKNEPLVIDKWLHAQATAARDDTLETVKSLTRHCGFDYHNPNKVYSLIVGFTRGNPRCFHASDGSGYAFLEEWVQKLDPINPQVAARVVSAMNNWKKYIPALGRQMQSCLQRISKLPELSKDVSEIVTKSLR